MGVQSVSILGATGSIGLSTLDVISLHSGAYKVFALSANSRHEQMYELCLKHTPKFAVMICPDAAEKLEDALVSAGSQTKVLCGEQALEEISSDPEVDIVMAAIVGAAGLKPSLAAVESGKKVLLANKEALVVSGHLFMEAKTKHNAVLLPIDSEHNAIFQCLPSGYSCGQKLNESIRKVLLTASGGPFREFSSEQLLSVTPAQACKHPNWDMGQKISVDSASLMNKGLELIEACWLFNIDPDSLEESIDVVIHPESVIHSMVEYNDGSVLAQLGNPDMRTPIAYGLAWPDRIDSGVGSLDLVSIGSMNFQAPDESRFPCLRLAKEAFKAGGTAPAVLNASNEIAVEAFLKGNIGFMSIPDIIEESLSKMSVQAVCSIEQLIEVDSATRLSASEAVARI